MTRRPGRRTLSPVRRQAEPVATATAMSARPVRLDIYRTVIAMRPFEHAAASRDLAEAVVVRACFADGSEGWGEALPRGYVTGETIETVARDLAEIVWPACRDREFASREDLLSIPARSGDGRCINAAACAAELALAGRLIGGSGLVPRPGGIAARVSGVLGAAEPGKVARRLRMMRWYGLRDFKLKLGFGEDVDEENLRLVHRRIGKAIGRGRCTFRVDVNGGWDAETTPERVARLERYGACVVEQPTYCSAEQFVELARRCSLPLMADESLVSDSDATALLAEPARVWWNIRISKNGGLSRALQLAELAGRGGAAFTVRCMVGESSILSAAQRRLLQLCPQPRFVEGNHGRFLLSDDLTARSIRFGCGGRLKVLKGPGLGVSVDRAKLSRHGSLLATLDG